MNLRDTLSIGIPNNTIIINKNNIKPIHIQSIHEIKQLIHDLLEQIDMLFSVNKIFENFDITKIYKIGKRYVYVDNVVDINSDKMITVTRPFKVNNPNIIYSASELSITTLPYNISYKSKVYQLGGMIKQLMIKFGLPIDELRIKYFIERCMNDGIILYI
ncbi:hypothetical protein EBX93_14000 [bacterium]|nr:hypothetical protein [bacterium]